MTFDEEDRLLGTVMVLAAISSHRRLSDVEQLQLELAQEALANKYPQKPAENPG